MFGNNKPSNAASGDLIDPFLAYIISEAQFKARQYYARLADCLILDLRHGHRVVRGRGLGAAQVDPGEPADRPLCDQKADRR